LDAYRGLGIAGLDAASALPQGPYTRPQDIDSVRLATDETVEEMAAVAAMVDVMEQHTASPMTSTVSSRVQEIEQSLSAVDETVNEFDADMSMAISHDAWQARVAEVSSLQSARGATPAGGTSVSAGREDDSDDTLSFGDLELSTTRDIGLDSDD